jgi:hypothetical protein
MVSPAASWLWEWDLLGDGLGHRTATQVPVGFELGGERCVAGEAEDLDALCPEVQRPFIVRRFGSG